MNPEVFISCASEDELVVDQLVGDLQQAGVSLWYYHEHMKYKQRWQKEVAEAISSCKVVLLILSSNCFKPGKCVIDEIRYAHDIKKAFIPLKIENVTLPDEIRFTLRNRP